tara:strand:- start:5378 stop:6007 length:630 start_codon:yes stop_codon:yes gene_type:complete
MSSYAPKGKEIYESGSLQGRREPITLGEDLESLVRKSTYLGYEVSETSRLARATTEHLFTSGAAMIANSSVSSLTAGQVVEIVEMYQNEDSFCPVVQVCSTAKSKKVMGVIHFVGAPISEGAIPAGLSMADFIAVKDLYTLVVLKSGGTIPVLASNTGGAILAGQFLETDTGGALVAQASNNFTETTVAKSLWTATFTSGNTQQLLCKF